MLLPFWIALIKYPVTQVPIPHASRASYILSPEWAVNFFVVPYGALILALPFILLRGSSTPRLRPLLLGFWLAFLLGLGGTTPVGRVLLGRAFEVITMERFSYWATLLALPFVGLLAKELIDRFRMRAVVGLTLAAAATCALAVAWSSYKPSDALELKVDSVAAWLNRDGHDRYRYIALGFGNKIARLAVLTDASSVDGEWNSGRMLPELTEHGAGSLNALQIFREVRFRCAERDASSRRPLRTEVGLCSRPLLRAAHGLCRLAQGGHLEDRTISVWGKDDVPPATPVNAPQMPRTLWQGLMWGILADRQQHSGHAVPADSGRANSDTSPRPNRRRCDNRRGRGPGAGEDTLVMRGWLLALTIVVVTAVLITIGTLWPVQTAIAMAAPRLMSSSSSPKGAAQNLMQEIRREKLERGLCHVWPTSPSFRKPILSAI